MRRKIEAKGGDPIVSVVLDNIFAATQIDPSCILPDNKLGKDFGLKVTQIQAIVSNSAKHLDIPIPKEAQKLPDATPRQIVEILKNWASAVNRRAS